MSEPQAYPFEFDRIAYTLDPGAWDLASITSVPQSFEIERRQQVARAQARAAIAAGWTPPQGER